MKYLVTPPSRWKKWMTVHHPDCRFAREGYGEWREREAIPVGSLDCKVCGGRGA